MKKILFKMICSMLALLVCLPVGQITAFADPFYTDIDDFVFEDSTGSADHFYCDDVYYEYVLLRDGTIAITKIIASVSADGTLYIPSEFNGHRIARIAASAAENIAAVEHVEIPDSVTHIGNYAFYKSYITDVSIPSSVISVGSFAFSDCSVLQEINVSPDNPSYSSLDGVLMNAGRSSLICCPPDRAGTYIVPEGVSVIERLAFSKCKNLTEIILPPTINAIGAYAFLNCNSLEAITVPHGVTSIPEGAFSNCLDLISVSLPYGMTSIGSLAFLNNYALTDISIPSSVTSIADDAFDVEYPSNRSPMNVRCASGSAAEQYCRSKGISYTIDPSVDKIVSPNGSVSSGNIERISGTDRIKTAIEISKDGWNSADTVVLANGFAFPDALAGAPLASLLDAPILLTAGKSVEGDVMNEINRLGAGNIYILGGTAAVSANAEGQLTRNGLTVTRLAGSTRYETSEKIAEAVLGMNADAGRVFVVSAENYPDALSVSPVSAVCGEPIVFSNRNGHISPALSTLLSSNNIHSAFIIGGTSAVGVAAENNLKNCGVSNTTRISGSDRYETSVRVAEYFDDGSYTCIAAATGTNYPDALAGGVRAARLNAPIILVDPKYRPNPALDLFVSRVSPEKIYVFGGFNAMPTPTVMSYFGAVNSNVTGLEFRSISLSGAVISDDSGTPIPEAEVSFYEQDGSSFRLVASAMTNNAGTFAAGDVLVGKNCTSLLVDIFKRGCSQTSVNVSVKPGNSDNNLGRISVHSETGSVYGTVTEDFIPLPGASVHIFRHVQEGMYDSSIDVTTDANGEYSADLVPGVYYITGNYTIPGYNSAYFCSDYFIVESGKDTCIDINTVNWGPNRCSFYCEVRNDGVRVDGATVEIYLDGELIASDKTRPTTPELYFELPVFDGVCDIFEVRVEYGALHTTRNFLIANEDVRLATFDFATDNDLAETYGLIACESDSKHLLENNFNILVYDETGTLQERFLCPNREFVIHYSPDTTYYLTVEMYDGNGKNIESTPAELYPLDSGTYALVLWVGTDAEGNLSLTINDMA